MSYAYRCEVDNGQPTWRIERHGDAVVSWACDPHLARVCRRLQRDHEQTRLTIIAVGEPTGDPIVKYDGDGQPVRASETGLNRAHRRALARQHTGEDGNR